MDIKVIEKQLKYNREEAVRRRWWFLKAAFLSGNVSRYCRREGIKRSYYYFWFKRLESSGWDISSLSARSRRPGGSPRLTCHAVVLKIRKERKQSGRCALAIGVKLGLPPSTVGKVLKREGLLAPRRKPVPRTTHSRRYELDTPGEIVQVDVKYVPWVSGPRYYEFNAVDDCTRWRYSRIYPDKSVASTRHFVEGLIEHAPFTIRCIQTDHGSEFTNRIFNVNCTHKEEAKEHVLDTLCRQRGIRHKLIPVGQCEINGKVERSHRIDDKEFFGRTGWRSISDLRVKFERWIKRYNTTRLHGGIGWKTPAHYLKEKLTITAIHTV